MNKSVKIFGKLYTISLELEELKNEISAEQDMLEDALSNCPDHLEEKCEKLQDDCDEIQEAYDYIESAISELDGCMDEFISMLPDDLIEEMKNAIDNGKKLSTTIPKTIKKVKEMKMAVKSYIEDEKLGIYSLHLELTTDQQKKGCSVLYKWNGTAWIREGDLPKLNEEALNEYNSQEQEFLNTIWQNRTVEGVFAEIIFEN